MPISKRTVNNIVTTVNDIGYKWEDIIDYWLHFSNGAVTDLITGNIVKDGFTQNDNGGWVAPAAWRLPKTKGGTGYTFIYYNPDYPVNTIGNIIGVSVTLGSDKASAETDLIYPVGCNEYTYWAASQEYEDRGGILSTLTDGFLSICGTSIYDRIANGFASIGANYEMYENTNYIIFKRKLSNEEVKHFANYLGLNREKGEILGVSKYGELLENVNHIGGMRSFYKYDTTINGTIARHDIMDLSTEEPLEIIYPYDTNDEFESVHIVNLWDEEFQVGDIFPIKAYPIPFTIESTRVKIRYESSNTDVAVIAGNVMKCVGTGTTEIIARCGMVSDSFTITVLEKEVVEDIPYYVDESLFTDDYEANQEVIYEQIDYAAKNGYNHIYFTNDYIHVIVNESAKYGYKQDAYPYHTYGMLLPSNITIEFKGKLWFHKGAAAASNEGSPYGYGYSFFLFGHDVKNTHIKIKHFRGERYDFRRGTYPFHYADHPENYSEQCKLLSGVPAITAYANNDTTSEWYYHSGKTERCSLVIDFSEDTIGFFVAPGGTWNFWNVRGAIPKNTSYNGGTIDGKSVGHIYWDDMENGKINEDGSLEDSTEWTRTKRFIDIGYKPEVFDDYYIGRFGFLGGFACRLCRILWYDEEENLIQSRMITANRSGLKRPAGGVKFKISIAQPTLPTVNSDAYDDACYLRIGIGNSWSRFHYENHYNYNNESGIYSGVGDMRGCTVCRTNAKSVGRLNGWSFDLEDGWYGMHDTTIWNSCFGNLVNHATNTSIFNCLINQFNNASYCTRTNVNYCSILGANYTTYSGEKDLLTLYHCNIGNDALFETLSEKDNVQMIECGTAETYMSTYIKPFRE